MEYSPFSPRYYAATTTPPCPTTPSIQLSRVNTLCIHCPIAPKRRNSSEKRRGNGAGQWGRGPLPHCPVFALDEVTRDLKYSLPHCPVRQSLVEKKHIETVRATVQSRVFIAPLPQTYLPAPVGLSVGSAEKCCSGTCLSNRASRELIASYVNDVSIRRPSHHSVVHLHLGQARARHRCPRGRGEARLWTLESKLHHRPTSRRADFRP